MKARRKIGRPTRYSESYPGKALELCSDGATDKGLAKAFGVAVDTIYEWKKKYSEFSESIKKGKDDFDTGKVEASLLKRALGYTVTEIVKEPNEAGEIVVTRRVKKHVAADVTAQVFWLKNRQPQRWRDRQEVLIEHPDISVYLDALSATCEDVWSEDSGRITDGDGADHGE